MIGLDEFRRIDLRIGEILAAEQIVGTDRLLKVEVDLGGERRTLVTGIAHQYAPTLRPSQALANRAKMLVDSSA